jgi:hypothetical protein
MKTRAILFSLALVVRAASGANTVAIGDSLTAEYDTIPEIAGFPVEATAYAEVTVSGWVSMSWVEILARLRPQDFEFGASRKLSDPYPPPRLSGYERNWAVPGIAAAQYEDFLTSKITENPAYVAARQPLENQLRNEAERVVVWLGTNEFRANYGPISDGESPDSLIDGLLGDLQKILRFVKARASEAQVVIANLPDLGASPDKQASHPDPAKRALVTAAVQQANTRIAELAAQEGASVANVYATTEPLVAGEPTYFGAVVFNPGADDDNEPRHLFTRDGLHPNTALQIRIARQVITAFNRNFGAGIAQITDAEALRFLAINPNTPYLEWIESHGATPRGMLKNADTDALVNLAEYAFALNPTVDDAASLPATRGGPVAGIEGDVSLSWFPDRSRSRHIEIRPQYSADGVQWTRVPPGNVIENLDTSFTAVVPSSGSTVLTRLKILTIPPKGSTATVVAAVRIE